MSEDVHADQMTYSEWKKQKENRASEVSRPVPCSPHSLAVECVQLKDKLARAGLWKTMHKMDEVVEAIGWELSGNTRGQVRD